MLAFQAMTFAEIIVFMLLIAVVWLVLSPLQKRLEKKLYTYFRSQKSESDLSSTIDVTDSIKKDTQHE